MFSVYRPEDFPDIDRMFSCWQGWAQEAGLPGISFIKTLTCFDEQRGGQEYAASVSFEPWLTVRRRSPLLRRAKMLAVRKARAILGSVAGSACHVLPYEEIWKNMVARPYAKGEFRGAFVGWDNSPRLGNRAKIVPGASPEGFGHFFRQQLQAAASEGCPFVFVNAWNEWAEGAMLEPDEAHGLAYLEQLRNAVNVVKEA